MNTLVCLFGGALCASAVVAAPITVDFNGFANGQQVGDGTTAVSPFFALTTSGGAGGVIFDSDPAGPNSGGADTDLLVDLGGVLTVQEDSKSTQTVPGIFDTPDDEVGFTLTFDFFGLVELQALTLVDINGGASATVTLTDDGGLTRVYSVPAEWTHDIADDGPNGFQVLDLTILTDQVSIDNPPVTVTATEDLGFDPTRVTQLVFDANGSSAVDNLVFIPSPGSIVVAGLAGMIGLRRRR